MPAERLSTDPDVLERTRRLLAGAPADAMRRVISRSVAVGSGKGGVGKTITACNLAIYYARKDLRVGLVDLDPLSDVASLLDLYESEQAVKGNGAPGKTEGQDRGPVGSGGGIGPGAALDGQVMPVFRGLDILFPYQKLARSESRALMEAVYRDHLAEIDRRYDLLIFDMPAGLGLEDNLAWIPFMTRLVLVTNPEPTAHASAGAYAKEVQRLYPGTVIQVWHNRFSHEIREGFHPSDVAGNYNRFVEAEDRLTPQEMKLLRDFAFVPEDPALDLLKGEPHPEVHVLKAMHDAVDYAHGRLLSQATRSIGLPPRIQRLVTSYVQRNPEIGTIPEYLGRMEEDFRASFFPRGKKPARPGERLFSERQAASLTAYLDKVTRSGLRRELVRIATMLDEQVRRIVDSQGPFAARLAPVYDSGVDRELGTLLVILNRSSRGSLLMRNQGVLLLFYFSLHKLFQSRTLVAVLRTLIPRRKNQKGRQVRDRYRQIRALVERDPDYRARYLKAVKTFHALVTRQVGAVARALELWDLVLLDKDSKIDGRPYVKLIAAFLHETLYSGLSVIVGFDYRSAAAAFQDGAERLLSLVRERA